jgi:UDP-arabinose 4-epimerase
MSRAVLVTGGAGYIGSHTCKALAQRGVVPIAFDNLSRGHRSAVQWGPLVVGDIADKDAVKAAINRYRVDAVVHFAAFAYVGESVSNPAAYFRNNVAGSLSLLEAMTETEVRHLVFSSTCAVYGVPPTVPISEETVTHPINPYGESKLQVERMLSWFGASHGLKWTALRYFNAAGADPAGDIGEQHDPETHLIPLAIHAALGDAPPLQIFGSDYPTPDGTAVRDYIHVSDLAEAHLCALDYLRRGGAAGIFNLGTGRGYSVREVLSEIGKAAGCEVPCIHAPRRAGDPPQLVADARRAQRVLDWRPEYSDLASIVRTALAWERTKRLALAAE